MASSYFFSPRRILACARSLVIFSERCRLSASSLALFLASSSALFRSSSSFLLLSSSFFLFPSSSSAIRLASSAFFLAPSCLFLASSIWIFSFSASSASFLASSAFFSTSSCAAFILASSSSLIASASSAILLASSSRFLESSTAFSGLEVFWGSIFSSPGAAASFLSTGIGVSIFSFFLISFFTVAFVGFWEDSSLLALSISSMASWLAGASCSALWAYFLAASRFPLSSCSLA